MANIIQRESPILAVITEIQSYMNARADIDAQTKELAKADKLVVVADIPMAIRAMTNNPEVRKAVRPTWIDSVSIEQQGKRDGDDVYEVSHSTGSFATLEGLKAGLESGIDVYGFMVVPDTEWAEAGKGKYLGKEVPRVSLSDLRAGKNIPSIGTPYTVFTKMKDNPNINPRGQLTYDQFMNDDRVLMTCGSPEEREALAKMLFGKTEEGGEGWSNVGSYHRLEARFGTNKGRPAYLHNNHAGLDAYFVRHASGRFLGVAPEALVARGVELVRPSLEQVIALGRTHVSSSGADAFKTDAIKLYTQQ